MKLKTFDVFSDYVFDNIEDINHILSSHNVSPHICLSLIKALHYNKKFHQMSVDKRFSTIEPIIDYLYCCSKSKIDTHFVQGVILLFVLTDSQHYHNILNKCKIIPADVLSHEAFVTYFSIHPFLSYQICDKDYETYLKNNLSKGIDYVLSTLFIQLLNKSDNFDDVANAFLTLGKKHQRKILDRTKRLYDCFKDIELKITNIHNISLYGYVFISFFKNASDYITDKNIIDLESNILPEEKEVLLFIKQQLTDNTILHKYINQQLADKSLAFMSIDHNNVIDLFKNIASINLPKSSKDYSCSVILTTSNPDIEFLGLSIDSLLNQTLKNIEIIIMDDCSDNSDAIKKLQEKSQCIKYIRSDINQGAYISRNIAMEQATGDYIFFQDDDDVSHPQRLEYSVDNLLATNAKIFHTCVMRFSRNGMVQLDTNAIISSDGPISMCFHRKTFDELGGFMPFRSRGDVEYRSRCTRRFGIDSYVSQMDVPLYYALGSSTSLSISFEAGASFYNLEINRNIISKAVI